MEGRVYVCSWKQEGERYRLWVTRRPKIAAEGSTFEAADQALWEAILDATGDGETAREYDPPAPSDPRSGAATIRLVTVSGNSHGWIEEGEPLFTSGLCPECGMARGERTDAALRLSGIDPGAAGGIANMKRRRFESPTLHFFSERFVALLTDEERARFEWRPVVRRGGGRKAYLELAGSRLRVPLATHRSLPSWGWRCGSCGWTTEPHYFSVARPSAPFQYVSATALPSPLPSCFTVGQAPEFQLCFTRDRWRELVGKPGAKDCKAGELGVLGPGEEDPAPTHRPRVEVMAEANARAAEISAEVEAKRVR